MFNISIPRTLKELLDAENTIFIDVRGTIAYSCLSRMQLRSSSSSDRKGKEVLFTKPHYEVSLSDAHVVRNPRCHNPLYLAVADYFELKIAEQTQRGLPFHALDFNPYSAEAEAGTLPLREDGTLRAELAQGVDVTLKLRLVKNPENGITDYTFYGITVNEPARFYDYHARRPICIGAQAT